MSGLTVFAIIAVAYTLTASKLDRWWISAPMVFVAAGTILGPGVLDVLPASLSDKTVLTITELTLAMLLFSDASTVRLRDVEGDANLPTRLLFAGLPLTIAAGALTAHLVLAGVGWAMAALIATILAPTDAALGLAVVTNQAVPVRIRRALNVESGLNDGIATPFVTFFIAVVASDEGIGRQGLGAGGAEGDRVGARHGDRGRVRRWGSCWHCPLIMGGRRASPSRSRSLRSRFSRTRAR
jgi:sodium/hydrogen antiporter